MSNQTQHTLPAIAWKGIVIEENGEKLVEVRGNNKLKLSKDFHLHYTPSFCVRETIQDKIHLAANNLPDGNIYGTANAPAAASPALLRKSLLFITANFNNNGIHQRSSMHNRLPGLTDIFRFL